MPTLAPFTVTVDGYAPEVFHAETRAKAMYRAFRAFSEAYRISFRDFLGRASISPGAAAGSCAQPPGSST